MARSALRRPMRGLPAGMLPVLSLTLAVATFTALMSLLGHPSRSAPAPAEDGGLLYLLFEGANFGTALGYLTVAWLIGRGLAKQGAAARSNALGICTGLIFLTVGVEHIGEVMLAHLDDTDLGSTLLRVQVVFDLASVVVVGAFLGLRERYSLLSGGEAALLDMRDRLAERRQAEEALRESELRYRLLADNATDMIARLTPEGVYLYVSPSALPLLGYAPDELRGQSTYALLHPEDVPDVARAHAALLEHGATQTVAYRVRRKDGRYVWFETVSAAVHGPRGEAVVEIQCASRDITRRRQVEDNLRFLSEASTQLSASLDYEATLASLARLAVPGLADWCTVDMLEEGSYRRVAVGYPEGEGGALAGTVQRTYPLDPASRQLVVRVLRSGRPVIHPDVTREDIAAVIGGPASLPDGEALGIRSAMCVPLMAHGQVLGAMTLLSAWSGRRYGPEDLTAAEELALRAALAVENAHLYRQAHETARREQQHAERLRLLAGASVAISAGRSPEEMLRTVTEQARHIVGAHRCTAILYARGEQVRAVRATDASDASAAQHAHADDPAHDELWRRLCPGPRPVRLSQDQLEAQPAWREPEGERPPTRGWLAAPLTDQDGATIGLVHLTDRLRDDFTAEDEAILVQLAQTASAAIQNAWLQQQAAAATAAMEADRLKTDLLNTVSHELRTPLASIKGFTTTLLMYGDGVAPAERQEFLEEIDHGADRLRELIDNLLQLSRTTTGGLQIAMERVALVPVLAAAVAEARRRHPDRQITLTVEEGMPDVHGDARRLGQVAANLIENALKFSPGGGEVAVRAGPAAGGDATFAVTDRGVGIAPEHFDRIFENFYRVEATREIGGTGLGLAICRRIVEEHGGAITVSSVEGEGSTFTVVLADSSMSSEGDGPPIPPMLGGTDTEGQG